MPLGDHELFLARVTSLPHDQVLLIDFAYDLAKSGHRLQLRDTGERYFEHLRESALILMDECNIVKARLICAT